MKKLGILLTVVMLAFGCAKTESTGDPALTAVINVPTMQCDDCAKTIATAAKTVEGVTSASVDKDKKELTVSFASALNVDAVRQAVANVGYDADNVKRSEEAYSKLDECCRVSTDM